MKDKTKETWWGEVVSTVKRAIMQHGGLFTMFAVVFILFTGITLFNNPGNWWIIALIVIGLFSLIFLFMNARVVIKSTLSIVLTIMLGGFGFSFAALADPTSSSALSWPMATLFLFFASLAASYALPSGRSRWGSIMVAQFAMFFTGMITTMATINATLGVIVGTFLGSVIFGFLHFFTSASRAKREHMPLNVIDDDLRRKLVEGATKTGYEFVDLSDHETDRGGFLVWKDRAYLLYPIKMSQPLSVVGRRKPKLGYKARSINPWLLNVAFKETPVWRARGADIMVVLVDTHGHGGGDTDVLGADLPDTKKQMAIGLTPGRSLTDTSGKPETLYQTIEQHFAPWVGQLSKKQRTALQKMQPDMPTPDAYDTSETQDDTAAQA